MLTILAETEELALTLSEAIAVIVKLGILESIARLVRNVTL